MEEYKIYSHILCNYQGKELTEDEVKRANTLTLLFLINDTCTLFNLIKKIETDDLLSIEKHDSFYSIEKYCDQLFSIASNENFSNTTGLVNKIFFYLHILNKEEDDKTVEIRSKIYEKIKVKIEQIKLDLYIMEKKLSPYDKKEPEFNAQNFLKFIKIQCKKLLEPSFVFLEKNLEEEAILLMIIQKKEEFISLFGRKKIDSLLLDKYPEGQMAIQQHLMNRYHNRGFSEFINHHLKLLKNYESA